METTIILLGIGAMYAWVHFLFIQHGKTWTDRNTYEKAITIMAIVAFALILLGLE